MDSGGSSDIEEYDACSLGSSSDITDDKSDKDEYKIITADDIWKLLLEESSKVSELIDLNPATCRLLLSQFNYDSSRLLEKLYEFNDAQQFLREGVAVQFSEIVETTGCCDICCADGVVYQFSCGHPACKTCWESYVQEKMLNGGSVCPPCPGHSCKIHLNDEQALSFLSKEDSRSKFNRMFLKAYVDTDKLLRWCPGEGCDMAVKMYEVRQLSIVCPCQATSCSTCDLEAHLPLPCSVMKRWMNDLALDIGSTEWMNAKTRDCPKCDFPIEKDGGCNFMTCRRTSCKAFFCWLCMKVLEKQYDPHNCFKFVETPAVSKVKNDLRRWRHYQKLYAGHRKSLDAENKYHRPQRMKAFKAKLCELGFPEHEFKFMTDSCEILVKSRRVLMFTNGFAFYLMDQNVLHILEENQRDLEAATEKLSNLIEDSFIKFDIIEGLWLLKSEILKLMPNDKAIDLMKDKSNAKRLTNIGNQIRDLMTYVNNRCNVLLAHCADCVDDNVWSETRRFNHEANGDEEVPNQKPREAVFREHPVFGDGEEDEDDDF